MTPRPTMTAEQVRQEQRRRQARIMKVVNPFMRAALRIPARTPLSARLVLVTHIGRKTGRTYHQPVSFVRDGDVLLTPGGGRWTRNLRSGEAVALRLEGRRRVARPDLVHDPDEAERLLRRMLQLNPALARFVPFVGNDGTIEGDALRRALHYGFRVVRWEVAA